MTPEDTGALDRQLMHNNRSGEHRKPSSLRTGMHWDQTLSLLPLVNGDVVAGLSLLRVMAVVSV